MSLLSDGLQAWTTTPAWILFLFRMRKWGLERLRSLYLLTFYGEPKLFRAQKTQFSLALIVSISQIRTWDLSDFLMVHGLSGRIRTWAQVSLSSSLIWVNCVLTKSNVEALISHLKIWLYLEVRPLVGWAFKMMLSGFALIQSGSCQRPQETLNLLPPWPGLPMLKKKKKKNSCLKQFGLGYFMTTAQAS